ncbi:UDP-N-acetylmuramoyl-L-alanine--D-glutamate ligase [Sphingomonas morindae]|uniref:UDP-N-acetylmuramoylalanine--D-glutamate ligase n=1 Tax=Sphingomonas morindae TaxID=1541170 RepID=A0ABY4X9K5_9SPHN|nr:UDP-N-acetylmuramoyl-L-alanine--D-glutamate ligase [Sphingomonas morindae]USI73634.1 UDP-N-acetylmuramoyl-L-alanine--D-glutamate ligase [Sphingomonas morindae]
MIRSPAFAGRHYAVLGLARSGLASVAALLAGGARVTAWDADAARRAAPELADAPGLTLADPMTLPLDGMDGIVVSPGVPLNTHPIAARAAAAGVPVIGDIELFALARPTLPPHRVVGITGTNGKSTTTALVHHILEGAGVPTLMGGNIGLPILGQTPLPAGGVYVLELSSFQIDLTHSLACDVAALTNITPDHLDRYADFAAYAAAKRRLFQLQGGGQVAVIATDDDETRAIAALLADPADPAPGDAALFGAQAALPAPAERPLLVTVSAADIADQSRWPALQGPHNAQNVAVACAIAEALGIDPAAIEAGLRSYPGLPHRMERVATINGVLWVNDSKATNATSTAPALGAYQRIHWIAGGRRKTDELDACRPFLGHVAAAYTIGEATELFAALLGTAGVAVTRAGTLDAAVAAAAAAARPGDVVLLSPACASYDQFSDYEARGRAFVQAVRAMEARP